MRKDSRKIVNSRTLREETELGYAPAIGVSEAYHAVNHYTSLLEGNLLAAYVTGNNGRNAAERIEEAKVNIVIKDPEGIPGEFIKDGKIRLPKHSGVRVTIFTQEELEKLLQEDGERASRERAKLALQNIALHGTQLVSELRRKALQNLNLEGKDFQPLVRLHARERLKAWADLLKAKKRPPALSQLTARMGRILTEIPQEWKISETIENARKEQSKNKKG